MIVKMTALMTITDSSSLICLLCHSNIDLNAFTNIFYTHFPHNGKPLSNFVLKILKISNVELPSSYLCLKCFNSFCLLEQSLNSAANVQSKILETFQANSIEKLTNNDLEIVWKNNDIIENFNQVVNEESKLIATEYLTEKDLHSLKSIINEATNDTVISIEIISKPVNESSVISKDEGSQTNEQILLDSSQEKLILPSNPIVVTTTSQDKFDLDQSIINPKDNLKNKNEEMKNNSIDVSIQCDFTDYKDPKIDLETKAKTTNEVIKIYNCESCNKVLKNETELRFHLLNQHPDIKPYNCNRCGKSYKHKQALEIHLGMHAGLSPHKCPKCGKCFTHKGGLQRHLPLHTGETPYKCQICDKSFVHHTSYNMHTLSHTGKKSYQCKICKMFLLSTSHLKRHMRVHTGEKPFNCALCGKSFAERYNLQAHQKIHDPEQTAVKEALKNQYKCVLCPATFGTKAKYMEHLKTHVGELNNDKPKKFNQPNATISIDNSLEFNGTDLLAACVNEVWQNFSLQEEVEEELV